MSYRDKFAKKYPELDPRSAKFDPLKAIQSENTLITIIDRRAPIFYSVQEFEQYHAKWLKKIEKEQAEYVSQKNKNEMIRKVYEKEFKFRAASDSRHIRNKQM